jgi:outer membrane protein OmpA-like peptidoglycan-associated protein
MLALLLASGFPGPVTRLAAQAKPVAPAVQPAPVTEPFRFAFSYMKGDKFHVLSTVDEEVLLDHRKIGSAEILNRITFEVADTAKDGSSGLLRGTFVTSERAKGATNYLVTGSYDSEFTRDRLGNYTIGPQYYMPVVRNVPVFPDRELSPGDTWTAPGEERHDLRQGFGIPDPYPIPFVARYRYEGPGELDGRPVKVVTASYTIFYEPPPPRAYNEVYPVQISGFSDERIFWDPGYGQPAGYEERFKIVFDWSDGRTIEYRGTAKSRFTQADLMDRGNLEAEAKKAMGDLAGVSVKAVPEGVAITLEDIQFSADSAALSPAQLERITRIAGFLKAQGGRDIIVAGHTALAGTAEGRKALSEARARAVADRLVGLGARDPTQVQVEGWGAERPVADNASETGKARNRRVEIIIREN